MGKTFIYLLLIFIIPLRYLSQHLFIHPQHIPERNFINLRCAEASLFKCVHKRRRIQEASGSSSCVLIPSKSVPRPRQSIPPTFTMCFACSHNRVNQTAGSLAIRNVGQKCRAKLRPCHTAFSASRRIILSVRFLTQPQTEPGIGVAGDKKVFEHAAHP